jgi:hypothetical protein
MLVVPSWSGVNQLGWKNRSSCPEERKFYRGVDINKFSFISIQNKFANNWAQLMSMAIPMEYWKI